MARLLNLKKDLEIPYILHFICLLIILRSLHAKLRKNAYLPKLLVVKNWGKMDHLPRPATKTSFENFIYITIFCNDTPLS